MSQRDARVRVVQAAGIVLVVLALAAAMTGADVAANDAGSSIPDFPLVYGELTPSTAGPVTVAWRHRAAALLAVTVALVVAAGHARRRSSRGVRWVAWTSVALAVGNTWLAARHVPLALSRVETVVHAGLGWCLFVAGAVLYACRDGGWRPVVERGAGWLAGAVVVDAAVHAGGVTSLGASVSMLVTGSLVVFAFWVSRGRAPWIRRGYLALIVVHVLMRAMSGWTSWAISPTLHAASTGVLLMGALSIALRPTDRN